MSAHSPLAGAAAPTAKQRIVDRIVDRSFRLPEATNAYTIARDLPITMRDGTVLLADLYSPVGVADAGTILVRGPYGFGTFIGAMSAAMYARRGYHVVLARCRGTFGSGGRFEPMVHEVADGADTVEWLRRQPWFDGRLATFGGSYLGFTQWALLVDPPPELVTAVISIAPHDWYGSSYKGGAFMLQDLLGWANQVGHQEDGGFARRVVDQVRSVPRVARAVRNLPIADGGERFLAGSSLWYRDWVSRRDPDDPMWEAMRMDRALDRTDVPVLLQTGWQDLFVDQTVAQYEALAARGVDVGLTVGPWTHGEIVTKGGRMIITQVLDWFAEHLAGTGVRSRAKPVQVFVTGDAPEWRHLDSWPPPTTSRTLYLSNDGALDDVAAPSGREVSFRYDPADPTPTVGGPVLLRGGYRNDTKLAERGDVVTFDTAPLGEPVEVAGCPVAELDHRSDGPHADVFVRICDVDPSGRSRNVTEMLRRRFPGDASGPVELVLDPVAHRFGAGHRIRVLIAGGSFPRWERNLGTGDDPATSDRMQATRHTIGLAGSSVTLPVT